MRKLFWCSVEQTWQLNWWPLNKYCLKLMLSNRLQHICRESRSNYRTFYLARCFDTVLLSLHLSFSLLFPNTFLFLPSHFSLRQRKLEMQEHIVTVGCFHLHSHLWHGQAWATSAPWTNWFFFYQNEKKLPNELAYPQQTNECFCMFKPIYWKSHVFTISLQIWKKFSDFTPRRCFFGFCFISVRCENLFTET